MLPVLGQLGKQRAHYVTETITGGTLAQSPTSTVTQTLTESNKERVNGGGEVGEEGT